MYIYIYMYVIHLCKMIYYISYTRMYDVVCSISIYTLLVGDIYV